MRVDGAYWRVSIAPRAFVLGGAVGHHTLGRCSMIPQLQLPVESQLPLCHV